MIWLFLGLLLVLVVFAALFIMLPAKQAHSTLWLPFSLCGALVIFAGTWYFFAGAAPHIIYENDNIALRQIAQLLDDSLPLPPEVQNQVNIELERQQQRNSAQPTVWLLQAQLAMQQQDYLRASQAYAKAYALTPDDPDVAISYAQTWYLAENQTVTPELQQFLQQLQQEFPTQPGLINLLAVVAFQQADYNKAIQYWQQLLPHYAKDSSEAQTLQAAIIQAKTKQQE